MSECDENNTKYALFSQSTRCWPIVHYLHMPVELKGVVGVEMGPHQPNMSATIGGGGPLMPQ